MKCRKCRAEIPDGSRYCLRCGVPQQVNQATKSRGNGTGSVFKRGGTWTAVRVLGYTSEEVEVDGQKRKKLHKTTRSKGGFRTKKEALEYLPQLGIPARKKAPTWAALYDAWKPTHRAGKSTMDCYAAAEKWFRPIWPLRFDEVDIDDLQECLDDCPKGKRTRENMKALAGLLYKYAIPRHLADLNLGQYLIVGAGDTSEKQALPEDALEAIRSAVGRVQGADYILMDEPFAGNDLFNREDFYKVLVGILEPQETLLLSTHLLEETAPFLSRALLLRQGTLVADLDPLALEETGADLLSYVKRAYHYQADRVSRALTQLTNGKEPLP